MEEEKLTKIIMNCITGSIQLGNGAYFHTIEALSKIKIPEEYKKKLEKERSKNKVRNLPIPAKDFQEADAYLSNLSMLYYTSPEKRQEYLQKIKTHLVKIHDLNPEGIISREHIHKLAKFRDRCLLGTAMAGIGSIFFTPGLIISAGFALIAGLAHTSIYMGKKIEKNMGKICDMGDTKKELENIKLNELESILMNKFNEGRIRSYL